MTTVLIILAVIAIGFIVYKLEKKPKKVNLSEAPEKIEPTPTPIVVVKKAAAKKSTDGKSVSNKKAEKFK